MPNPTIIADFESSLSTAISPGATSFSLSVAVDDDGVALPSGNYYFTIDNGSSNKEYLFGVLAGSSVTGVKHVSRQGVETTGANLQHRVGASVLITDFLTYKAYIDSIAVAGAPVASNSVTGITKLSTAAASPSIPIAVGDNDTRVPTAIINTASRSTPITNDAGKVVKLESTGYIGDTFIKSSFGGTGVDGALTVASGTTTIDLLGKRIFVKQYTSISITGTGKVTFSNPHSNGTIILLKSQGDVTLTSSQAPMLDASGMGAECQIYGPGNPSYSQDYITIPAGANGTVDATYPTKTNASHYLSSPLMQQILHQSLGIFQYRQVPLVVSDILEPHIMAVEVEAVF